MNIIVNDGSNRHAFKADLIKRVEDSLAISEMDDNLTLLTPEELATRNNLIVKKVTTAKTTIKFKENLHPRNEAGVFTKKGSSSSKGTSKVFEPIDSYVEKNRGANIKDKVKVLGSDGFKNVLAGLSLGAINEVMAFPKDFPTVRVIESSDDLDKGLQGFFQPKSDIITIGKASQIGSSTLIHELGHFLDQHTVGSNGKRLSEDPSILSALLGSKEYKDIEKVNKTTANKESKGYTSYLMQHNEMFARAYAQWVSTKSSNKTLKKEIKSVVDDYGPLQWGDESFKPISKAFDTLFKSKGLLRKK